MSAETSITLEMDVETVEMDDGLVEVGAVSDTKGSFFGTTLDPSGASYKVS